VWPSIQAIRERYDRHAYRWVMPHITLLYPFRPQAEFPLLTEQLRMACRTLVPFLVCLKAFRYFDHGRGSYTLWLAPEPEHAVKQLQGVLQGVVPDCDDVSRYAQGFTPHLSVAQARGQAMLERLKDDLQAAWQPLSFEAAAVQLIWRNTPPDDVFRVGSTIPLGTQGPAHIP
jgi:2'-5' RNA ligase